MFENMEDIVKQLSLMNENFVKINTRLDETDARIDSKNEIFGSRFTIIEEKIGSYD